MEFMFVKSAAIKSVILVKSLWTKLIATGRIFKIRRDIKCTARNTVYWKPRLSSYKSDIKKLKWTCETAEHFVKVYNDNILKSLCFVLVDSLNNVENLTSEEKNVLLLKKGKFETVPQ